MTTGACENTEVAGCCITDDDCEGDDVCVEGMCATPTPDETPDAGPTDAGGEDVAGDAGPVDAGEDTTSAQDTTGGDHGMTLDVPGADVPNEPTPQPKGGGGCEAAGRGPAAPLAGAVLLALLALLAVRRRG